MTLTDFLLARIAEDEAAARVSIPRFGVPREDWETVPGDPRVLAECEAKRRIVAKYQTALAMAADALPIEAFPRGVVSGFESVIRDLASVYAAHPDYRDEWKLR